MITALLFAIVTAVLYVVVLVVVHDQPLTAGRIPRERLVDI